MPPPHALPPHHLAVTAVLFRAASFTFLLSRIITTRFIHLHIASFAAAQAASPSPTSSATTAPVR
jgi:hypothetical protein